jgi:hypothetical protein
MGDETGKPHQERRSFPRYSCAGAAEIFQNGSLWGWGTVNEVSYGGCYIEMANVLPTGTEALFKLTIADAVVEINARVASNHPWTGMGVEFIAVTEEQENKLDVILRKVSGVSMRRVPRPAAQVAAQVAMQAAVRTQAAVQAPPAAAQPAATTQTVATAQPVAQARAAEPSAAAAAAARITKERAPEILTKIVQHINQKGVLTKQELVEIVKSITS